MLAITSQIVDTDLLRRERQNPVLKTHRWGTAFEVSPKVNDWTSKAVPSSTSSQKTQN
jgi:hypothetical protein